MSVEPESREGSEAPARIESEGLDGTSQDNEESLIVTDLPVMHTAKRLKVEARKLDGMQRELYSLLGENTPPVVVAPNTKFKTKQDWQQRAAAWKVAEFEPKNGLTLRHWVRAASVADGLGGDRFSRFNTEVHVPKWSDSDYALFSSENWSLEETKYLFELARDFDLRWLVIADRYNFPASKPRTVEQLKERYYEVSSSLIKNRPVSAELGLSPHDEELLAAMKFDRESEEKRKEHLERLLSRNPKEIAEEEALILEARRLENMSDRIFSERRELLKWLESPGSLNPRTARTDLNTSQGVGQLLQELQNEKGRKSSTPATATGPASGGGSADARKTLASIVAKVLNRKLMQREELALGIAYTEPSAAKHPGVYLRSAKLTPVKQNLLPRVRAITSELGLPLKPVMPTARICGRYESLYQSITILLEAKKIQDKLEMEIDVLKRTRDVGQSNGSSSLNGTSNGASNGTPNGTSNGTPNGTPNGTRNGTPNGDVDVDMDVDMDASTKPEDAEDDS